LNGGKDIKQEKAQGLLNISRPQWRMGYLVYWRAGEVAAIDAGESLAGD
jgi:hypothetical protein